MSSNPFPKVPSPITLIANNKSAVNAILDSVTQGEIDAMNNYVPGDISNKRGMLAYCFRDTYLHSQFNSIGWNATDTNGQRRILSPVGQYPYEIQLLHTRGRIIGNRVMVCPKGKLTKFAIKTNANLRNRQLELHFDGDMQKPQAEIRSIWIISRVYKNILKIYVVEPTWINSKGTEMHCIEYFSFPECELSNITSNDLDLPQGIEIIFPEFEVNDERNDEDNNESDENIED
jgi:hypothetical protein